MTYDLDEEKFRDLLGDMITEGDDEPIVEIIKQYVIEDGCPTENNDELMVNVSKAYLIYAELLKKHYQKKIEELTR